MSQTKTPSTPPKSSSPLEMAHRELVQRLRANPMSISDLERAGIEAALITTFRNVTQAALVLGIGRTTLYRKMKLYGIPQ